MSYTVLARRYRSRDFDEIVGQEAIARTLKNAVRSDRTAHAYLFSGTRGVGKTSMARILARALNVNDGLAQAREIADAIFRGEDLDVIEIDGASNRGVQDARDLIAGAGLSPTRCPFKIYIIDEVHMLTPEAFNTLLKTMEEPPAHVKFILCTTLPHKVPATIQSRCQRFEFRPLSASRIAGHLAVILKQEGVEADQEVLMQVARLGNGSMRDALSLLDRLLAAGEPRLSTALLEQLLGVPDHALVQSIVDAIVAHDAGAALEHAAGLLEHGATVTEAIELLTEYLRTLLLVSVCGPETDLIDASSDVRQAAARHAAGFDAAGLVHLMVLCDSVARNARGSSTARALFDATIVRLCMAEHLADIPGLLASGGGSPDAVGAPPTRAVEPKKKAAAPERPSGERPAGAPELKQPGPARAEPATHTSASSTGARFAEARLTEARFAEARLTEARLTEARLTEARLTEARLTEPKLTEAKLTEPKLTEAKLTEPKLTEAKLTEAKLTEAKLTEAKLTEAKLTEAKLTEAKLTEPKLTEAKLTEPKLTEPKLTEPKLTEPKLTEAKLIEAKLIEAKLIEPRPEAALEGALLWEAVVEFAQGTRSDQARIEHLRFESIEGQTLRLAVTAGADDRMVRVLSAHTAQLADLVARAVGRRMRVEVAGGPQGAPAAAAAPADLRERVRHIPEVAQAIDLFDAVVVDVQSKEG